MQIYLVLLSVNDGSSSYGEAIETISNIINQK
jgi:hypothetical protein